ncbi:MAG TPA: hypothetical protein VHY91_05650 [Pirellulales bacterium]|nr:hypothetical protein [Pirellulales bacterium]
MSLLLFVHLFAVVIALASYTAPSALQERLRILLAPYLATLNFDLNPNRYPTGRFYLTHDLPVDVDAVIRVDATLPDGTEHSLTIPEPGLWPPERRRHYQALANAASTLVEDDDYQAVLPKAIAGAVLRSWGASTGTVRVERHLPLQLEEAQSGDANRANPFGSSRYSTIYEAKVLVSPSGQVDLAKKVAAGEVAPVDKKATGKATGDGPSGDQIPSSGGGN